MADRHGGRQARRTRGALFGAFHDLVLGRRYSDIRVADIIRRADVGRSTFYEHFRDKDDLLRQSLSPVLRPLADAVSETCNLCELRFALDHFRQHHLRTRAMLNGPSGSEVVGVLAGLIEKRLAERQRARGQAALLSLDLVAAQVAESLLGLVRAWLNNGAANATAPLAAAMNRSAIALTGVLLSA
jgi:AcrR family transcriptional regulator